MIFFPFQASEKALKAVLFWSYADHDLRDSHDICSIAEQINDVQIHAMADQLDQLLPNYSNLRYPDVLEFPRIPADVYDATRAMEACQLAEQILQRAVFLVSRTVPSCCQAFDLFSCLGA